MTSVQSDLAFASALEQAELVRRREVSPVELVDLYAERIEMLDGRINAHVTLCLDEARDAARAAEAAIAAGDDVPPFCGVPISVKDLVGTAGLRTTHGSKAFAGHVPERDDEVVRRMRAAGFVVLGKTNTPEFGATPWTDPEGYGSTRNPWDPERTAGGSSGGAAAAVAAGMCAIAHGSDGGGSIRIPASACGLVGLKPSRGRVTAAPRQTSMLSQNGWLTRTVGDAAAALGVIAGPAPGDAFWASPPERPFARETEAEPGRLRVAVTTATPTAVEVAAGNREAAEDAAALLAELGHAVEEATPPWGEDFGSLFATVWAVLIAARDPLPPSEDLDPPTRAWVALAEGVSGTEHATAWTRIADIARRVVGFFDDYDVLLTPTVACPPPHVLEFRDPGNPIAELYAAGRYVPYTPIWNATGQPAISLPLATDALGLPVGVQLVGRPADEATLIRLSAQIEAARPWRERRPPTS